MPRLPINVETNKQQEPKWEMLAKNLAKPKNKRMLDKLNILADIWIVDHLIGTDKVRYENAKKRQGKGIAMNGMTELWANKNEDKIVSGKKDALGFPIIDNKKLLEGSFNALFSYLYKKYKNNSKLTAELNKFRNDLMQLAK